MRKPELLFWYFAGLLGIFFIELHEGLIIGLSFGLFCFIIGIFEYSYYTQEQENGQ